MTLQLTGGIHFLWEEEKMSLYKIGDVAKKCNISIKTLRYYEELELIKPIKVDIYSGYRYYDESNIKEIYKIQFLKELGFTLQEIHDFSDEYIDSKIQELNEYIEKYKANLDLISSLKKQKGERIMKPFINDELAIGKWSYECSTISKEAYKQGDYYHDEDALMQELYFLPNGEGYWIFDRWTKGVIYHYNSAIYNYTIEEDKLFVEVTNENNEYEITLIFNKSDSKEYMVEELERTDDTNMPFLLDESAVGSWVAIDYTSIENKESYTPGTKDNLFLKSLTLTNNGVCFKEYSNGNIDKINWTKDYIMSKSLASNYIIKDIDNDKFLIMDWKSGDYVYGGKVYGCYVFKKI